MPFDVAILLAIIACLLGGNFMSAALDRLTASVAALKTTAANVVAPAVPATPTDDAALSTLADQVDAIEATLAALVPAPAESTVTASDISTGA